MAIRVVDLGRLEYGAAYRAQVEHLEKVLASRESGEPECGRLLLVEHDPVITMTRRAGVSGHLLASPEMLTQRGVALAETDRGGDITYHGPGQLVAYPILDLNLLGLGLHAYMRLLENSVIQTCAEFGIEAFRDCSAIGVWVGEEGARAKICAMGVRVRKWISMHGLALNVSTDLDHFGLIVPCGLPGRAVTSLERELRRKGQACPPLRDVQKILARTLSADVNSARAEASRRAPTGAR